ncbi:glycosyltransferase family 2 protein, partial [Rhizobium leguminosarum]
LASDILFKLILSKADRAARMTLSKVCPVREQKGKNFRKFEEIDPLVPLVGGCSRFRTKEASIGL